MSTPSRGRPPRLATWMLTRLYTARRADSLIGDLHEQFAEGRSQAWYWRQVFIAIATAARESVRGHAFSLVLAIATAWAAMLGWFALNMWITGHMAAVHFVRSVFGIASFHDAWMTIWFVAATTRAILFALAGWLAVRLHREHPYTVAVAVMVSAFMWRWVPWRTYRAFDADTLATIHAVTAIGGLLLGAAWALYKEKRRAPEERGVSSSK